LPRAWSCLPAAGAKWPGSAVRVRHWGLSKRPGRDRGRLGAVVARQVPDGPRAARARDCPRLAPGADHPRERGEELSRLRRRQVRNEAQAARAQGAPRGPKPVTRINKMKPFLPLVWMVWIL